MPRGAEYSFMSQWGSASDAGVKQKSRRHVNEAETQFKYLESMIDSITRGAPQPGSARKGDSPWHVASGMPVTHRAGKMLSRGQGLWSVMAQARAVRAMSSAASRHEHGQAGMRGRPRGGGALREGQASQW